MAIDGTRPINLFSYRELTADFIDQFYAELQDRNQQKDADTLQEIINTIKRTTFARMATADEVIKWHRDQCKIAIYVEFVSRGYFFLMAHLMSGEVEDGYLTLRTALAESIALSFVPTTNDIHSKPKVLDGALWLANILAPSNVMRFMAFVLLIQLTSIHQEAQASPQPNGEGNGS